MGIIDVNHLTFSYDGVRQVLNDLSFSVQRGMYVTILGHNGSGKSTLAKLLAGLLEFKKGSIALFDQPLNEKNIPSLRNKVGIVFQNPDNQFIGSTVADDIAFGLENRCVPHEHMDRIIQEFSKKVSMEKFLDREPQSLSGGQKQRVAIAGVLAMKPELIIMDEATAMLDPRGKREIREITKAMKRDNPNLTILSITHDVEEALDSDQVLILNEGKIAFYGVPKDVFSHLDALRAIELDVPFIFKLIEQLKREGIIVQPTLSLEALVQQLWR